MENEPSIEAAFKAALEYYVSKQKRGFKAALARRTGMSPQQLANLLAGYRYGSEEIRRKIVGVLCLNYEDFLNTGRSLLKLNGTINEAFKPKPTKFDKIINNANILNDEAGKILEMTQTILSSFESKSNEYNAFRFQIEFFYNLATGKIDNNVEKLLTDEHKKRKNAVSGKDAA
jgi:transcriptional regulator with XRE-family HTH domain